MSEKIGTILHNHLCAHKNVNRRRNILNISYATEVSEFCFLIVRILEYVLLFVKFDRR